MNDYDISNRLRFSSKQLIKVNSDTNLHLISKNNDYLLYIKEQLNNILIDKKDKICVICYEDIEKNNFVITSCNHKYHFNCLLQHLTYKNTCPLCRSKIEDERPRKEIIILNNVNENRNPSFFINYLLLFIGAIIFNYLPNLFYLFIFCSIIFR